MLQEEIIAFGLDICVQSNAKAMEKSDGTVENKRYLMDSFYPGQHSCRHMRECAPDASETLLELSQKPGLLWLCKIRTINIYIQLQDAEAPQGQQDGTAASRQIDTNGRKVASMDLFQSSVPSDTLMSESEFVDTENL
ncbi:hypothetical protein DUI87_09897 [Hirundo rustica rustica]|uniref:Uncharacterized protein n=1 Tax=Hirundo rustica rustica TaxID=333673 RepID=A0A3M0KGQ8_HIRRU|nr:hypothetical protein DUI87_09897 [Hirundo rustica rustica]